MEIGPPVLEKSFEGFLPYMGVAAILVMRPESFIQTLVPPSRALDKLLFQMSTVLVHLKKKEVKRNFKEYSLNAIKNVLNVRPEFFYFLVLGTFGVKHRVGGGNKNKNKMRKML